MLYKQAYTFSWKKRWQRFFLLWFHNSSSLNCLVPPLSIHAFEREYGAKNACFACLQDYILKKKAFNAMKSQHVMSGILESWVESNMVTNTYTLNERWSVLMITGNLKAPGTAYKDLAIDRCPRISFLKMLYLTVTSPSLLKPHLRKPGLSSGQTREQYSTYD